MRSFISQKRKDTMSQPQYFHSQTDFKLENGTVLPGIDICYHIWGKMNEDKDNVIWICHSPPTPIPKVGGQAC
jgi:homoserine O-acetyltransferase